MRAFQYITRFFLAFIQNPQITPATQLVRYRALLFCADVSLAIFKEEGSSFGVTSSLVHLHNHV